MLPWLYYRIEISLMNITFLTIATFMLYLAVSAYQFWLLKKHDSRHIRLVALLALVPLNTHGYLLHLLIDTDYGQNLSMINIFSTSFWLIGIALVIASLMKKLEILVMAVFPVTAIVVLFTGFSDNRYFLDASSTGYLLHILIAIAALSITSLAAIQSVFVNVLDNKLRQKPTQVNLALPALQDMEKLLYLLVGIGFVLLTLAIITAIMFMPSGGDNFSLHKPVLSVASWLVLGTFLIGHYKKGWRGKTAVNWTMAGFILLFLAYFGTRTVLEYILG